MKIIFCATIGLFILSAFISLNPQDTFKKLYVLEGTWKMNLSKGALCEEWKKVDPYYLQNKGYLLKGNDTIVNERVALKLHERGILYTSTVVKQNNSKPIDFTLTKAEQNEFVFENDQHDFPKRITYHLITPDSLHAWIDDGVNGSNKRQDFYYKKQ